MAILKPPSDDGTLLVTYKGSIGSGGSVFGPSELLRDVAGYEGSQDLTIVHFNNGSTVECRDVLMVRTSRQPPPAG